MTTAFALPSRLDLRLMGGVDDPCLAEAAREVRRLLARLGCRTGDGARQGGAPGLSLAVPGGQAPVIADRVRGRLRHDGYAIAVGAQGVALAGRSGKAVLNAVYDLMERLGVRFLLPGEAGEFIPARPQPLAAGLAVANPRFPHRGVFWQQLASVQDHPVEDWLRFHAKLRFNAVAHEPASAPLARTLGLRLEVGGHGLAALLPRERFAKEPELFRMFQPQDFGGRRQADANLCIANPRARAAVAAAFRAQVRKLAGVHAVHAWADDLPAGGWCQCPSCRSLTASDQAMIAMRVLADAARAAGSPVQVPMLAYHDTIPPSVEVPAAPGTFLLYAPRERCYAHALDDRSCPRNRVYLQALRDWTRVYGPASDPHSFEYYFDQILFRGMYPFLPGVVFGDLAAYQRAGITTHLSLQVAGPEVAPEYNLLAFSWGNWQEGATTPGFLGWLTASAPRAEGAAWRRYLAQRARHGTAAMAICGHQHGIYLDYRWLPESTSRFAAGLPAVYGGAARGLAAAAAGLERAWSGALAPLMRREAARVRFEADELRVMARQQAGSCALARHLATGGRSDLRRALAEFARARAAMRVSRRSGARAGLGPRTWYQANVNRWLDRELAGKIALHRKALRR